MKYSLLSKYRAELMGIAMLMVMLFHAGDLDIGVGLLNDVFRFGFCGVDVFIFLSAMGLSMSLSSKEIAYPDFIKKRALRILPEYYTVMIPYTLCFILREEAPRSALIWNASLLYYWVRPAGMFNWYVAGIMFFYLIMPFWHKTVKESRHRLLTTLILIAVGIVGSFVLIRDGYWNHVDILYRVPVFALGTLIGFYIKEDRPFGKKDGFCMIGLTIAGALITWAVMIVDEAHFIPICFAFLAWMLPVCLALGFVFDKLPLRPIRAVLAFIGKNSLGIYLLNVSLFPFLSGLRSVLPFGPSNRLYYLLQFTVNILLGALLHFAVEKAKGLILSRQKKSGTAPGHPTESNNAS